MARALLIFCIIIQNAYTSIVLSQSSTNSQIIFPTVKLATKTIHQFPTTIPNAPQAVFIWDGVGNDVGCSQNIKIQHNFTVTCLNQPIYAYITSSYLYTSLLNGVSGTGNNPNSYQTYTISTSNIACNQIMTLYINASANGACNLNPTGLLYAVVSDNCAPCNTNYFFNVQTCNCQLCSIIMTGCLTCTLKNVCITCSDHYFLNSTSQVCQTCNQTCYTCSNSGPNDCISCDYAQFRLLNGSSCICNSTNYKESITTYPLCEIIDLYWCASGFYWNNSTFNCQEICGDGLLFNLQCDDGNIVNGDGCSSTCTMEINYTCINGSNISKSICSFNQQLTLSLININKEIKNNTIIFTIDIQPELPDLAQIDDYTPYIQTSISNNKIQSFYINSLLYVYIDLSENVQDIKETIKLNLTNSNVLFAVPKCTLQFVVNSNNNIAASYYDKSSIQSINRGIILINITEYLGFVSLLIGPFSSNLASIQLISMMQSVYLNLATVINLNSVQSCFLGLNYINGYNNIFKDLNINYYNVSNNNYENGRLYVLNYHQNMIENFNDMFILETIILIIAVCYYLISDFLNFKQPTKKKINYIIKQIIIICFIFNLNNFSFSFGLQSHFSLNNLTSTLQSNQLFMILIILVSVSYIFYLFFSPVTSGQFILLFNNTKYAKYHFIILAIFRFIINFITAYFFTRISVCIAIVILQSLFFLYLVVVRPYTSKSRNIVAVINELFLLIYMSVNLSFRQNLNTTTLGSLIGSWILIVLFVLVIIVNYIQLGYLLYEKITKKQQIIKEQSDEKNITSDILTNSMNQKKEKKNGANLNILNLNEDQMVPEQQSVKKIMSNN